MDMAKRLRRKFIAVAVASVAVVLVGIVAAINVASYWDVCTQADAKLALIQGNGGTIPAGESSVAEGNASNEAGGDASTDGVGDGELSAGGKDAAPSASEGEMDSGALPRQGAGQPNQQQAADPEASRQAEGPKALGTVSPRGNAEEMPFETRYFTVTLNSDGAVFSVNTERIAAVSSSEAAEMAQGLRAGASGFMGEYRYSAVQQSDGTVRCVFLDCSRDLGSFTSFLTASIAVSLVGLLLVFALVLVLSRFAIRPVVESYQKQKAFITDASHEIKTPLAVISAANEVQEMEQGETEWSRSIAEQVKRLSGLTERLVFLARMDEGAAGFTKEQVELSSLVQDAAQPFYQVAEQRGKRLHSFIEQNVQVKGDAAALSQVVELLLDNATRYAKDNTQIELSLKKHGSKVQLSVSNEVEHMPEGNLDKLFERFYRDDSSRSSQTGGSGVGLSVVRSIAEAHNGIAKATASGNRITFTVTL